MRDAILGEYRGWEDRTRCHFIATGDIAALADKNDASV